MAMSAQIIDMIEKLSDERKDVIYRLTLDMLSAQETEDFDDYSPKEVKEIGQARKRIADGECLSFSGEEEIRAHFGVN